MSKKALNVFIVLLILFALVLMLPGTTQGSTPVSITLNGQPVESDVRPYIDSNSRTMVPARFIAEALGASVEWDGEKRKVQITRGASVVALYIGEKLARVDGEGIEMDTIAVIKDGRTMVPLRFLAETFGMDVEWIAETRSVSLTKVMVPDSPKNGFVYVTGNTVNIRPGPGTKYQPVISQVTRGDELILVGQAGDWYQVRLPAEIGGHVGWIAGWLVELKEKAPVPDDLTPGEEKREDEDRKDVPAPALPWNMLDYSSARSALVMKESVNVRASSNQNSPIIDKVAYGDWLEVIGEQNRWYQVRLSNGQTGWIAGWLVATRYEPIGRDNSFVPAGNPIGSLLGRWSNVPVPHHPNNTEGQENQHTNNHLPVVTDIDVYQGERGVIIQVTADGSLNLPSVMGLTNPTRLAFDFNGLLAGEKNDEITPIQVDAYPLTRVRASQFEKETVRVVADLKGSAVHSMKRKNDGSTVEIVLQSVFPLEKTVVIDPGHGTRNGWGSTDPGAIGPTGVIERDVVTRISQKLGEILLKEGYSVIFTREEDTGMTLEERSGVANQSGGIFVSIHANAHPNRDTAGTMTFYPGSGSVGSEALITTSKELAGYVQKELLSVLKRPDKGIRQANFSVLRNAHTPAILVEVAFLSNYQEEKLLAQEDFQNRAALAIAQGIQKYLNVNQ